MKRLLAGLLALCLLAAMLTGCGAGGSSAAATATAAAATGAANPAAATAAKTTTAATEKTTTAAATTAKSSAKTPEKEGGLYVYNVLGFSVKCKTNVYDYIQGDVFDFAGMAGALGYNNKKELERFPNLRDKDNLIFRDESETYRVSVNKRVTDSSGNDLIGGICYDIGKDGYSIDFARKDARENPKTSTYSVNVEHNSTLNIDQIVIYAYLMENLPDTSVIKEIAAIYGDKWPS